MQDSLERLNHLGLPKWTQMLVWGAQVTEAQAKDILFRTDAFFHNLLNEAALSRPWAVWARTMLGAEQARSALTPATLTSASSMEARVRAAAQREALYALEQAFQVKYQLVRTKFVRNHFACSGFIHGPHGWCSPAGVIEAYDNIGSYPCALQVYHDWQTLAQAFPYLDLKVTLMDAGEGESEGFTGKPPAPRVTFVVKDGTVAINFEAEMPPVVKSRNIAEALNTLDSASGHHPDRCRQGGIPDEWIRERAPAIRDYLVEEVHAALQAIDADTSPADSAV